MKNHTTITKNIRLASVLAACALTASVLGAPGAEAGPVEDIEQSCMIDAPGTADSKEQWFDHCQAQADPFEEEYHDCMRTAPGTADSLERWVEHCAAEAAATTEE